MSPLRLVSHSHSLSLSLFFFSLSLSLSPCGRRETQNRYSRNHFRGCSSIVPAAAFPSLLAPSPSLLPSPFSLSLSPFPHTSLLFFYSSLPLLFEVARGLASLDFRQRCARDFLFHLAHFYLKPSRRHISIPFKKKIGTNNFFYNGCAYNTYIHSIIFHTWSVWFITPGVAERDPIRLNMLRGGGHRSGQLASGVVRAHQVDQDGRPILELSDCNARSTNLFTLPGTWKWMAPPVCSGFHGLLRGHSPLPC